MADETPEQIDLQIVADSFHVINDSSVFERLMDSWDEKINRTRFGAGQGPGFGLLRDHYGAVEELLERLGARRAGRVISARVARQHHH